MPFAIMRSAKIANMGALGRAFKHCFREQDTPNADPSQLASNEHQAGCARSHDEAMGMVRDRLPEKRRKDAVIAVEYLFTASPEWFQQASPREQQEFFKRSLEWLEDKYGMENVVVATVHRDESTPHMSAFVVPLMDGKLCAKRYIGNIAQMSKDQTSFAEKMKDLGLERGIKNSKAQHKTIGRFYAELNKTMDINQGISTEDLKPKKVNKWNPFAKESPEQVAQRINRKIEPLKARAMQYQSLEQRCKGLEKQNQELSAMNASLKKFRDKFAELTDNDFEQVNAIIRNRHQSNAMLKQVEKTSQEQRKILRREEQAKRQGIRKGMEH